MTRVLVLVGVGMLGMAIDLAFLAHTEDFKQYIPFIAIALALAALGWRLRRATIASVRAVRLAMVVMVITALTGVVLHYRANMEFQLESDPSARGLALVIKVLQAKAPPALAPLNMALLGLIGLAATDGVPSRERG